MFKKKSKSYSRKRNMHSYQTIKSNLMITIFLSTLIYSIFLSDTAIKTNSQVYNYYYGEYGAYGKELLLMKDQSFYFSYHGCSQSYGSIRGKWKKTQSKLLLETISETQLLDSVYLINGHALISISDLNQEFVLSE